MKLATFLQLFLLLDVFLMGALTATAIRHAYAHFRPPKPEPAKSHPAAAQAQEVHLSAEAKQSLLKTAEMNFKAVLDHSATHLHHELETTSRRLNDLVEHMGTEVVGDELERYRVELTQLRKKAETEIGGIRDGIAKHQTELQARLAQEMEAEKQMLIKQIDTKLADAVGSFLIETLQHNVDLGAQSPYLMALLEEHKADFVKGVSDEVEAAQ